MIFWNINELKRKINNNEVTEVSYFIYYILGCISLLWLALSGSDSKVTILFIFLNGVVLPIVCYSFHHFYQNKHFVEKYFALSLVSVIRLIAYVIIFPTGLIFFLYSIGFLISFVLLDQSAALYGTMQYFTAQMVEPTSVTNIAYQLLANSLCFWYIAKHYYDLCKQNALSEDS